MSCDRCSDTVRSICIEASNKTGRRICAYGGGEVFTPPINVAKRIAVNKLVKGTQVPYASHNETSPNIPKGHSDKENKSLRDFLKSYPAPGL